MVNLLESEKHANQHAKRRAADAEQPEQLRGPSRIVQQELDDHEVEEHADSAPDSVIALPALTLQVDDRHFRDAGARRAGQRRDEPVQLTVQIDFLQNLAPVSLEGCA